MSNIESDRNKTLAKELFDIITSDINETPDDTIASI
jgi:hypothetical protein